MMKKWLTLLALSAGLITPVQADTWVNRVQPKTAPANQFSTGISAAGVPTFSAIGSGAMPAFTGGDCTTTAGSVVISCLVTQSGTGAVARSVKNKIVETLSVTDFGAVGDGIADDGPAFRNAIAACMASPGYRRLLLPQPPAVYAIKTLDGTGSAGILIGDGQAYTRTVSITSGAAILTSSTSVFTSSMVGAVITLPGAGAAGGILYGARIASYQSATQVTLDMNASTTISAASKTFQIAHSNTCNIEGEAVNPYGHYAGAVNIQLGAGLNRPLLRVALGAASPTIRNIRLDGNSPNQSGWAGGPEGKLYVVQIDDGVPYPEGSIECYNSWITGGYNGNLYIGSARGHTKLDFCWSQYSGQSTADYSIVFNGYDLFARDLNVGPNNGHGVLISAGAAYQWAGGQVFLNAGNGIVVGGNAVMYSAVSRLNVQANGQNGILVANVATPGGARPAGHQWDNITFDGNSASSNGTYADFNVDTALYETLTAPNFVGASQTAWNRPGWNIVDLGGSQIRVVAPVFASGSAVTAWTNSATSILCAACNIQNSFTPSFAGATTVGTPTYTARVGTWSRNNNEVTVSFKVAMSSLGSAAGYATISGLPFINSAPGSEDGRCTLTDWTGWGTAPGVAQTGYTTLSGVVLSGTSSIYFVENGVSKALSLTSVGEFAPATVLQGVCTYHVAN